MKILHITKKYPKALGGDAVAVSNLEKEQRKQRNRVVVLTSNCDEITADKRHHKFGLRDTPAALDAITPRRLLSLGALLYKSFRIIRAERPDVIHTHSVDMAFAASFAARWFKVPLVHSFHILTFPDPHHSWLRRKTELLFLRGARPQAVTAPNYTDVTHLHNAGITNAHILPYGIDLNFWQKKRAHTPKIFTFVTAARLESQKGNEYLIRAAALLRKKTNTAFKVVIVGEGSLREELAALAKQLKVHDIIEFVGHKTPEKVRDLYAASHVMVIPSLWESGPLTAFEAWAMKLPVIITPVGMFATEPENTKRLKLVKPADHKSLARAMEALLTNDAERLALARAGHKAVQKHSWAEMSAVATGLYATAIANIKNSGAAAKHGGAAANLWAQTTSSGGELNRELQQIKKPRARTFIVRQRNLVAGLIVASIAALLAAPLLSPTITTLTTLPLLAFAPGLLAILALWPATSKRPAVMISIGAALGFLGLALEGLLLNWTLPLLGESEPLQAKYLIPAHLVVLLLLAGRYYQDRWRSEGAEQVHVHVSLARVAAYVTPVLLPLLAVAGAFRQNNGASNMLTIVALSMVAVMVAWHIWKPKLMNASWLIFNIALALLLATSLRSWFISGFDISQEFQVFTATLQAHHWDLRALPGNAYNACLSLTTLPAALQQLSGVSPEVIFKFFYQVFFALTAVVVYIIGRSFVERRLAFLAALLYVAQTQFMGAMPAIARQEIGLVFFALMLLILLAKEQVNRSREALLIVLAAGLVLTHYSTTYVGVMLFAAAALAVWGAQKLYARIPRIPQFKPTVAAGLLGRLALLLLVFATVWYTQINHSSGNITHTLRAASHMPHTLLPDTSSSKAQLILGRDQDVAKPENVTNYARQQKLTASISPASVPKLAQGNALLDQLAGVGRTIVGIVVKIVIPLSPIALLAYKKTRKDAANIALIGLGAVAVFAAVIILPALSENYNFQRVFQQSLLLLGVTGVWALWLLVPAGRRLKTICVAAFVLLYFVLSPGSGLVNQLAGNTSPRLNYNNLGEEYSKYYVRESEVLSARWLAANCQDQAAWADRYATLRLTAYGHVPYDAIRNDILSAHTGCLYLDYANTQHNLFYATYKKLPLRYTTPSSSFDSYNLIYTNGESRVYQY